MSSDPGSTTALILAAGRGERLAPLAEPFMKPLYPVAGEPLIAHAVRFAREFGAGETVAVVSPRNMDRVRAEVPDLFQVVQREPTGVVDAIELGIVEVRSEWVLLLCADNTFEPNGTWFRSRVAGSTIGVRTVVDPTGRFTRVAHGFLLSRRPDLEVGSRWIGPVFLSTVGIREALADAIRDQEPLSIEGLLNMAGAPFTTIEMNCVDHGVAAETAS